MMVVGIIIGMGLQNILAPILAPIGTKIGQVMWSAMPWMIPTPGELISLRWRKIISEEDYNSFMAQNGFSTEWADKYFNNAQMVLDAREAVLAHRKEYISDEDYDEIMRRNHFTDKMKSSLEAATMYFPTPGEVIMWAAREIFEPEIREKLRLDEKMPPEFLEYAKKAGMTEEMAKNYWAQHWTFPGWETIREMRHRDIITEEDVDIFFTEADIVPYWREALAKQMYRVYTRVDVRRMYRSGTLDREAVMRSYLDLGYDEEHAERMTDFTIKWVTEEPKTIAEGKIRQAYLDEKIERKEASTMVISLGYDDESADFIITLWDDDKAEAELKETIDDLTNQFLYLELSETQFSDKLDGLNLPQSTRERIFRRTIKSKSRLMRMPSRADLTRWVNSKIITPAQYEMEMAEIGYPRTMISRYKTEMESVGADEFRLPTRVDVARWFKTELINEEKWHEFMRALGYAAPVTAIYATELGIKSKGAA